MSSTLLRSRRSSRITRPLSRRLLFLFLSTTLAILSTYYQSRPLQPSTLPTPTSSVLTSSRPQIPVEIREKFQVVEVLRRFLYIIDVLIAFLFDQVLLLMPLFSSTQYFFYFVFALVIFQLDIVAYDDQSRSLSQFQQRYMEYRVQSRFLQQFKLIINQSNPFDNLKRSDFLKV